MEYVINVDTGWPLGAPTHKLHEVVELEPNAARSDVAAGLLIPADPASKYFTPELAVLVAGYRAEKKKREQLAADAAKADDAARKAAEPKPLTPEQERDLAAEAKKRDAARKSEVEKILQSEPVGGAPPVFSNGGKGGPVSPPDGTNASATPDEGAAK